MARSCTAGLIVELLPDAGDDFVDRQVLSDRVSTTASASWNTRNSGVNGLASQTFTVPSSLAEASVAVGAERHAPDPVWCAP